MTHPLNLCVHRVYTYSGLEKCKQNNSIDNNVGKVVQIFNILCDFSHVMNAIKKNDVWFL